MVEQCEGTVEQLCGISGVEQRNSDDGMVWWNSGTVWWNSVVDSGKVEH